MAAVSNRGHELLQPGGAGPGQDATYDAVEKVLTGIFEPLSRHTLAVRWNQAVEAMAKRLEAQDNGSE
ncbi:hypothetical protein [Pseudarthrobacter sp. S3]|uniref:hypothetical protein n=1 Tax=unclassified Pseudarthrobacter TaxID=2647000 RepID=UPI0034749F18